MAFGMRWLYRAWYRWGTPPWVIGPREELVSLVDAGGVPPGSALDLGCGVGDNSVFLAARGFEVVGVDYADSAVARARLNAAGRGVAVDFRVADVTSMPEVEGPFDLIVDYGTFDDLPEENRPACYAEILRVSRPGTRLLLWCFEHPPGRWAPLIRLVFGGTGSVRPGEIEQTFGPSFDVERIANGSTGMRVQPSWACYLMTRKIT